MQLFVVPCSSYLATRILRVISNYIQHVTTCSKGVVAVATSDALAPNNKILA